MDVLYGVTENINEEGLPSMITHASKLNGKLEDDDDEMSTAAFSQRVVAAVSFDTDANLRELEGMFPALSVGELQKVLYSDACQGDVQKAATNILESGLHVKGVIASNRGERRAGCDPKLKEHIMSAAAKHAPLDPDVFHRPLPPSAYAKKTGSSQAQAKDKTVVKYHNNEPIKVKKGVKYVAEKVEEKEELQGTYITLNVITKGKRGK